MMLTVELFLGQQSTETTDSGHAVLKLCVSLRLCENKLNSASNLDNDFRHRNLTRRFLHRHLHQFYQTRTTRNFHNGNCQRFNLGIVNHLNELVDIKLFVDI